MPITKNESMVKIGSGGLEFLLLSVNDFLALKDRLFSFLKLICLIVEALRGRASHLDGRKDGRVPGLLGRGIVLLGALEANDGSEGGQLGLQLGDVCRQETGIRWRVLPMYVRAGIVREGGDDAQVVTVSWGYQPKRRGLVVG